MTYNYSYEGNVPPEVAGTMALIFFGIFLVLMLFYTICQWRIFSKMGIPGWVCLIPFYNNYRLFDELYGNGLLFALLLVPGLNLYVVVKSQIDMCKGFDKSTGFIVGYILVTWIFMPVLAFDSSEWEGSDATLF